MKIDKNIKECPYCGSEEYYIKQSYTGKCNYFLRFDGKEAENGEMWENSQFKNISKYAWCRECGKKGVKMYEINR